VAKEGSRPLVFGVGAGLLLAAGLSTALAALIEPLQPAQPSLYVVVCTIIAGTTLVALFLPARRALAIPPSTALRGD
jgi:ABC-type antimicrobial peptide transport system permease subunit